MRFDVNIAGNAALLVVSETGRYASDLDAVMAAMRAAHDINLTAIVYGDVTCLVMDEFTGGLRKNSEVVKELLGITVKDEGLFTRLTEWLGNHIRTFMADRKHDQASEDAAFVTKAPCKRSSVESDIRSSNRVSSLIIGRRK